MAQPTPYSRQYNFTNFQTVSPSSPLPADYVDLELNSVKATLDATLNNLKLIQRDDTALANGSVGYDQLKAELNGFGFNPPSNWATATQYQARDTVFNNNGFYRCLVSHVSGTFADDLAAGDWELVADFASIQTAAAASAAAAATSATTATTQAGTATTKATAAAASATTATNEATAAAASATTATNEATAAHTDRLAADADVVSTHADAAQTASDRTATANSATSAANSAAAAAASAGANTDMPTQINAATETALADGDEFGVRQASSGNLIKRTFAALGSQLASVFLPLSGGTLTGWLTGVGLTLSDSASIAGGLEVGSQTGGAGTGVGFIDFHTGDNEDNKARISASGGTAGGGSDAVLNYEAAAHFLDGSGATGTAGQANTVVTVRATGGANHAVRTAAGLEVNLGAFDGLGGIVGTFSDHDFFLRRNNVNMAQITSAGLGVFGALNTTGVLTENGQRVWSANNFPAASAVGALVFAGTSAAVAYGATVAGSTLQPGYENGSGGGNAASTLPGTWVCLGNINTGSGGGHTLFQRIA